MAGKVQPSLEAGETEIKAAKSPRQQEGLVRRQDAGCKGTSRNTRGGEAQLSDRRWVGKWGKLPHPACSGGEAWPRP